MGTAPQLQRDNVSLVCGTACNKGERPGSGCSLPFFMHADHSPQECATHVQGRSSLKSLKTYKLRKCASLLLSCFLMCMCSQVSYIHVERPEVQVDQCGFLSLSTSFSEPDLSLNLEHNNYGWPQPPKSYLCHTQVCATMSGFIF